jgi:Tfp pilus assembly protein PilF
VTAGGWKYIEAPRPELYDLRTDPGERVNRYASEGQRARTMRSRLLDAMGGSLETALVGAASPKLDAETQRRLASLGYVSGSGGSGGRGDPKDAIADFQSYTRSVRGAFEAYDRGDLTAAIRGFESAAAGGRAAFDVYYYLGSAYVRLGQPSRAIAPLREAIRKNVSYTPSSLELAAVYMKLERPDEATAVLREALVNDPRSFQLHSHLGYAARLRRDLAMARQEYEAARALNPRDFDVRMNLSSIYRDGGDVALALHEVDAALEMRPDAADAHNQRGMLLGGAGRFREAVGAFERATALSSRNAQFWYNLGLARFRAGDRPGAAAALRRTLALKPDFADARTLLAEVERK